jgi:polar amino acid transport system permease protein
VARVYGGPLLRRLVGAYVETIRNTPLLIQIFIVYFGLSSLGLKVSAEVSAVIALTVNMGAYTTEIMRAGIQSILRTQLEAADCLGLTRFQAILHVVLLPAMERVYPSLASQGVLLMLASSITSQISTEELTATANLVQSDTYRSFEVYVIVAVVYLALSALYRLGFWAIGQMLFERRRRLGTPL